MLNTLFTMKTTWDTLLTKLYVTKVKGLPKSFFSLIGVGNACLGTMERAGTRVLREREKRTPWGRPTRCIFNCIDLDFVGKDFVGKHWKNKQQKKKKVKLTSIWD